MSDDFGVLIVPEWASQPIASSVGVAELCKKPGGNGIKLMEKMNRWLWAIAIIIFSALLLTYAYDLEQGTPIGLSSTQAGRQEMLMAVAGFLGVGGSLFLALSATCLSLYYAISQHLKNNP